MPVRLWAAIVIFLGSYLPLSVILLVQDIDLSAWSFLCCVEAGGFPLACLAPLKHPLLALGLVVVSSLCFAMTVLVLSRVKPSVDVVVHEAVYKPNDMINYVFPYVVSFMQVTFDEPLKLIGFLIFMTWLFVLSYRSGRILMNPLLIVFGWRIYEVTYSFAGDKATRSGLALARNSLVKEGSWMCKQLEDVLVLSAISETETDAGSERP